MSRKAASTLPLPASGQAGTSSTPAPLPLTASMVIGIIGLFSFLSSQILVLAGAVVWALGAYLHLARTGLTALGVVIGVPVAWLCWKVLTMAISAERDPANN